MSVVADRFASFVDIVADSLDDHELTGDDLAARVHLSRFHFDAPATAHTRRSRGRSRGPMATAQRGGAGTQPASNSSHRTTSISIRPADCGCRHDRR
jgi:hypothetical protein